MNRHIQHLLTWLVIFGIAALAGYAAGRSVKPCTCLPRCECTNCTLGRGCK